MKVPSKFERFFWNHLTEILSFVIVVPIVLWWCNGCSAAWLKHKPSEEERQAIRDSIRKADEKIERDNLYWTYHDIDQPEYEPEGGVIRLRVSEWGHGNEYSALPDIIIKKWSNHNGDKKKCRKQFIETEKERGKYIKIRETYITDVVIENNTIKFYSPSAFIGTHLGETEIKQQDWVNCRTTKLKDCGIDRVLFYDSWIEKSPRLLSEYILTDKGVFKESVASTNRKVNSSKGKESEKLEEYKRFLKNKKNN